MPTTPPNTGTSTADLDLQTRFNATPRPTADHPALNLAPDQILPAIQHLRDQHHFDLLSDITAIDNGSSTTPRFTVIYHLLNTTTAEYIRLAADCPDNSKPAVPSISQLFPAANWHERETFDLLGINFANHPDLRRILMWDGYPYHPLRKDFPLAGIEAPSPDPEVAAIANFKINPIPLAGGPFVAQPNNGISSETEPTAKDESWTEKSQKPSN